MCSNKVLVIENLSDHRLREYWYIDASRHSESPLHKPLVQDGVIIIQGILRLVVISFAQFKQTKSAMFNMVVIQEGCW